MLAAVARSGGHEFSLEEVAIPSIAAGEVLVKVKAVAVTRGLLAMWLFTDMVKLLPGILGYGIAGVAAKLGAGVEGVQEGDRIGIHALLTCGNCDDCRNDRESLCTSQCTIGGGLYSDAAMPLYERYHNGGMAEYVRVPATSIYALPRGVPDEVVAHVGTLAGSLRALRLAEPSLGDSVVITGASGASGAAAVRCAPLLGFTSVCGVATRREGLKRLLGTQGLTDLIALSELADGWEDRQLLTAAIRELHPDGVHAVVDFIPFGREVTVQSIAALKAGGRAILSAGNPNELTLSYLELMRNQLQLKGIRGTIRRDENEVVKLLAAGRLHASDLVTHVFPLTDVNRALKTVLGRDGSPTFVVLKL